MADPNIASNMVKRRAGGRSGGGTGKIRKRLDGTMPTPVTTAGNPPPRAKRAIPAVGVTAVTKSPRFSTSPIERPTKRFGTGGTQSKVISIRQVRGQGLAGAGNASAGTKVGRGVRMSGLPKPPVKRSTVAKRAVPEQRRRREGAIGTPLTRTKGPSAAQRANAIARSRGASRRGKGRPKSPTRRYLPTPPGRSAK